MPLLSTEVKDATPPNIYHHLVSLLHPSLDDEQFGRKVSMKFAILFRFKLVGKCFFRQLVVFRPGKNSPSKKPVMEGVFLSPRQRSVVSWVAQTLRMYGILADVNQKMRN